ncbi:DNA ligase [Paenibacillus hodogayensis]|uniref:DNA ligase (ATP) n=1 Tax=Paenibacillus hodogayensis TaxID=279208 RepID=A0ABV5W2V7_9BACL
MNPIIPFEPVLSESVPLDSRWLFQVKWDGVRILTYRDGTSTRLFNRKKHERTHQFPELLNPAWVAADSFILDGEVIALAADGKPSFHEVMRRDGIRRLERVPQARRQVAISYMIFDILYLNGQWLTECPLEERQRHLAEIVTPNRHAQLVESHTDGAALFKAIQQQGMEGIVAKDGSSAYAIEGKDKRWVKIKNYGDIVAVIGGFTVGDGGVVNAVLAGLYHNGGLLFIGKVGTGKLTGNDWRTLTSVVRTIETPVCPFAHRHPDMRGAYWVKPVLTAKIQFTEWRVHEGRTLRQPSIQAFVSVPPESCVFE